jgi:DHA1 family bicyclomycin/chloramphenicol resistance-like MFS transporter
MAAVMFGVVTVAGVLLLGVRRTFGAPIAADDATAPAATAAVADVRA